MSATPDRQVGRWIPRTRGRTEPPQHRTAQVPAHHAGQAAGRSGRRPGLKRLSDLSNPGWVQAEGRQQPPKWHSQWLECPFHPAATATHKDVAQRCDPTLTYQPSATLFAEAAPRHARAMTPLPESAGRLARNPESRRAARGVRRATARRDARAWLEGRRGGRVEGWSPEPTASGGQTHVLLVALRSDAEVSPSGSSGLRS